MTQTMNGKTPLAGSVRLRSQETKFEKALDPTRTIHFTVVIRMPPSSSPMPDVTTWRQTPLHQRRTMPTTDYRAMYSADKADLDAVVAFFKAEGMTIVHSEAVTRTVEVAGSAAQINSTFAITLNNYTAPLPVAYVQKSSSAQATYTHHGYDGVVHITNDLSDIIVGVVGLDNRMLGTPSGPGNDPPGAATLLVSAVANHYNFPSVPGGVPDQTIGIHAPQQLGSPGVGPSYLSSDVNTYFTTVFKTAPTLNDISLTVGGTKYFNNTKAVHGTSGKTDFTKYPYSTYPELIQDICTSSNIAEGTNMNIYFTEGSENGYLVFFNRILLPQGEKQPTVVSSSFTGWLNDDTSNIGSYTTKGTISNLFTNLLQQLSLLGINVFIAAGDWGTSTPPDQFGNSTSDGKLHVYYPQSDPWVISCGGTVIGQDLTKPGDPWNEVVWSDAFSASGFGNATTDFGATAGGVSWQFPSPSFQTAIGVTGATDSTKQPHAGRVIPDVAGMVACGNYQVNGLSSFGFTGTSCVAPMYAGLFANFQSVLGISLPYANSTIYQLKDVAFNDVSQGNNSPNDTQNTPYYSAIPNAFDACSGLGSIDGTKLLNGISSLLFPPAFYFQVEKTFFGLDEVTGHEMSGQSVFTDAVVLVLEGFAPNSVPVVGPTLSGSFTTISNELTTKLTAAQPEVTTLPLTPQRISYRGTVTFQGKSIAATTSAGGIFPVKGAQPIPLTLSASFTIQGQTFTTSITMTLVNGEDPYFTNVNPDEHNVSYLSQDLRVFTVCPGINNNPIPGATPLQPAGNNNTSQDTNAGFTYIKNLINYLDQNFNVAGASDPFASFPDQSSVYAGDSSVTPSQVNPANATGPGLTNYNFAVARVRISGTPNTTTPLPVRVFFRLWAATSFDTDFDPATTYLSTNDASTGLPRSPLVGSNPLTIPFFATGNFEPNGDHAKNTDYTGTTVNQKTITIGSSGSTWKYFGCFLNVYPTTNTVNGKSILQQLPGSHHCLVAQIAYDATPLVNPPGGPLTTTNSDKLAQRNIQVTWSDNPGPPSTHRIPQAFSTRPSLPIDPTNAAELLNYPDELWIDWGNTPIGSIVHIYWPNVLTSDILTLAKAIYSTHQLSAEDDHTIMCKVPIGTTYVPIPPVPAGSNVTLYPGLFTVDLPQGIVTGQSFEIVVRRISTTAVVTTMPPPVVRVAQKAISLESSGPVKDTTNWRYVVGTFVITIPVSTPSVILPLEEDTLAILRWRFSLMDPGDIWRPVLERYIQYVSGRVSGLGGNPILIPPSSGGAPPKGHRRHHRWFKCLCGCV